MMAISIQISCPQRVKYRAINETTTTRMMRLMVRERVMDLRSRSLACCSSAKRRESSSRGRPAIQATMMTNQIYRWPNLAKDFFHFLKQAARLRLVFNRGRSAQLCQQFTLSLIEPGRRLNSYLNVEVSFAAAPDGRHSFATHAQNRS